jgi:GNAT superfamily N-acetyltransferase
MSLVIRPLAADDTVPFIKAQWLFYVDDPLFVPPVVFDRKKLLNQKKNPFFTHAEMQLWLAERDGKVVGRIAGIVNHAHNEKYHDKVGFWGFFESSNDQEVASALFATVEQWLRERGMDTSRGPVNPSINDECGMLIDGWNGPPCVLMTYNPKYYPELVEKSGYAKAKDLFAYEVKQESYRSEKMQRLYDMIIERNQLTFRNVNLKSKDAYAKDIATIQKIYNIAWLENWGSVKMTDEEFAYVAEDLKQIADPNYIFFVECKGEVAGFILCLPDVNQVLIHNKKGSLLGAAWHLLTKKKRINKLRIIILGVLPEFQGKGIDSVLYKRIGDVGLNHGINSGEASWILEDNVMMNRGLTQTMNTEPYRRYRIYDKVLTNG